MEVPHLPDDRKIAIRLAFTFVLIVIACLLLGGLLQMLLFSLLDVDFARILSGHYEANTLKWSLLLTQAFTFLLPSMLFGWLTFRRGMWSFFGFGRPMPMIWLGAAIVLMFLALPIIQYSYEWNRGLPLPNWMTSLEENATRTLEVIMRMESASDLWINLVLVAMLPALGEELIFRGVMQQLGYRIFKGAHVSIWVTAFIFSAVHMQFEGFVPRLILGLCIGYLFYWTRNIWVPIVAHFFNNALMVVLSYYRPELVTDSDETPLPDLPWYTIAFVTLMMVPVMRYFMNIQTYRSHEENPL